MLVHLPDNASRHELLNLLHDIGVLHVVLERGGVIFRLLKDALHDGVLEYAHDLCFRYSSTCGSNEL